MGRAGTHRLAWAGCPGAVQRNDVVLVQSAAGGVGLLALDIIEALGARPIAVVGQDDKRDFLTGQRGIAPSSVIVRHPKSFGAQIDAATAALGVDGLDCVLDAVSERRSDQRSSDCDPRAATSCTARLISCRMHHDRITSRSAGATCGARVLIRSP